MRPLFDPEEPPVHKPQIEPVISLWLCSGTMLPTHHALVTSNKTRFTSVHAMLESVLRLRGSLMWLVKEHRGLLSATVLAALAEHELFFLAPSQLCHMLMPFTLGIHAVQSDDATMADVTRHFLARQMDSHKANLTHPGFKAHCIAAFNWRLQDMHNPICHLALSLRPWYRGTVSRSDTAYQNIRCIAASLWHNNSKSREVSGWNGPV